MGEGYLLKHQWRDQTWHQDIVKRHLDKLRAADIKIRNYSPSGEQMTGTTEVPNGSDPAQDSTKVGV